MRRRRTNWLDTGLTVLAARGMAGLRLEVLCERMSATRGSFYHHFVDMADFRRALLGHFEEAHTEHFIEAAEAEERGGAMGRLRALAEAVLSSMSAEDAALERSIRAWAAEDDDAAQAMTRVDERRVGYLEQTIADLTGTRRGAVDTARTFYLLLIGGQHVCPPLDSAEMRRLWEPLLERLQDQADRTSAADQEQRVTS